MIAEAVRTSWHDVGLLALWAGAIFGVGAAIAFTADWLAKREERRLRDEQRRTRRLDSRRWDP